MENVTLELETGSTPGPTSAAAAVTVFEETNTDRDINNELGDFTAATVTACQTLPRSNGIAAQTTDAEVEMPSNSKQNQITLNAVEPTKNDEVTCKLKLDELMRLKDSTKQLLCLIEELQLKSTPTRPIPSAYKEEDVAIPMLRELTMHLDDFPQTSSISKLQNQIRDIDEAALKNVHECSIYERLTRKCSCLNRKEYTDFVIHFNEDVKYATSNLGEIIKNIRILKKFLYLEGEYSKNAIMFLNEGLTKSPHTEKVDIILACSHADICNVFDNDSLVRILIKHPIQHNTPVDTTTQSLVARVLYRIAIIEEGRRYLTFNSKISNDIKQVVKNYSKKLMVDTKDFLNSTLTLLSPNAVPLINNTSIFYCKADEGMEKKILNSLLFFRPFMTLEEVVLNLELLSKLCNDVKHVREMNHILSTACNLFKRLLLEYNDSRTNAVITSILNKLIENSSAKPISENTPVSYVVSDTATEPTETKNQLNQASNSELKKKVKTRIDMGRVKLRHRSKSRKRGTS
ncbi:hypothetical protein O0L34_g5576 [Tuta absoluta]|nr:hypothetical protein O0L34_g5576 [Tuta absoluta]